VAAEAKRSSFEHNPFPTGAKKLSPPKKNASTGATTLDTNQARNSDISSMCGEADTSAMQFVQTDHSEGITSRSENRINKP